MGTRVPKCTHGYIIARAEGQKRKRMMKEVEAANTKAESGKLGGRGNKAEGNSLSFNKDGGSKSPQRIIARLKRDQADVDKRVNDPFNNDQQQRKGKCLPKRKKPHGLRREAFLFPWDNSRRFHCWPMFHTLANW